ncbi:MAG: prepilin-type N-terminal cleavage/methylation domain-containing protein [Pseudomonadales bacterium]|jgi:general secretion pathway protein G|nr:prepilin-type N-terminal cleavage/methylation domain-containing protein [Pseudomonadales bacterium]
MKKMTLRSDKGFTLIELMVVIGIIAILALLGVTSFQQATRRARDATRKSDLGSIRQALVLYRSDNGIYPSSLDNGEQVTMITSTSGAPGTFIDDGLTMAGGRYIREIPRPPNGFSPYFYLSHGNDRSFVICTILETPTGNYGPTVTGNCLNSTNCRPNNNGTIPAGLRNHNNNGCCYCVRNP